MADKQIIDLPDADPLDGSEFLHAVQGGNSRRVTSGKLGLADLLSDAKPFGSPVSRKLEWTSVAGSATQTILDYSGEGYVSSVFLAFDYSAVASIADGRIKIYYDGEVTPTIDRYLGEFFQAVYMAGAASPNRFFDNRFFGGNANGSSQVAFVTRLPIPFATQIKIEIVNGSASAMTVWGVATLQTGLPNTWPRTRKLRAETLFLSTTSANSINKVVDRIGKGRLAGLWMLIDDFPNSMNPVAAAWEGNFRFYIDQATKVWAASTAFALNDKIIDSNGHLQTVTTAGTSGGSAPSWSQASGGTTADGSVVWTQTPGAPNQVWRASRPFALNMAIVDPNGYVQRVTTSGTSGASQPSWNTTPGGTTTDNGITWTNQGNTYAEAGYQSSGAEDYFMMGFYGVGRTAMSSSSGLIGTTFCSTSPLSASSVTRSFYRFHLGDPITFDDSLVIDWQAGDTSQISWTSGAPRVWITAYYYTET